MNFTALKSKSFLAPSLLFGLYLAVMLSLLGTGDRKYDPLWRVLTQWDGQHYLSIAATGYEAFPCPDNPAWVCGNVGWFPLLPMAARAVDLILSPIGLDMRWSLLITSFIAFYLALLLLYRLVAARFDHAVALTSLGALLLFPTSFYFLTAFPYAVYLLLAVSVFYFLDRERYWACALPAGLLAVTYPSGIVITLPILWTLIARWRSLANRQRLALASGVAAAGVALILYALYYWIRFDDFFLYVHFQSKPYYAHEAAFPLIPIFDAVMNLSGAHPIRVILIFTAALLALFYTRKVPVSWQIYLWAVLLFTPSAGTTDSYYRHIVVAFPLAVMIGLSVKSPRRRWLLPAYAVASLILLWTIYLSQYKAGSLM